jgi:hypothetical protein
LTVAPPRAPPPLFELGRDGTADLIIVEGYTHSAADTGPGLTTSWEGAVRRCEMLAKADLWPDAQQKP